MIKSPENLPVSAPVLEALSCPRCGGAPDPEGGTGHLARCRSCGVLGRIDDDQGRNRLAVLPAIDRSFAARAVETHLRDHDVPGKFRLHDTDLLFVPFWRVRTILAGLVQGRKKRVTKTLERVQTEQGAAFYNWTEKEDGDEQVRKQIQRSVLAVISACPLEEYGLPTLDLHRQIPGKLGIKRGLDRLGEVVVFHAGLRREGTVLDPLIRRDHAETQARELLEGKKTGFISGLLPGATFESATLAEFTSLLFYPVFLLRFRAGRIRGTATVDGATGAVISLRTPAASDHGQHNQRLTGLLSLASGFFFASLARVALAPPPMLQSEDADPFRLKLLIVSVILGGMTWVAISALSRAGRGVMSRPFRRKRRAFRKNPR